MTTDRWLSPLRYPGGKARMADWLSHWFWEQTGPMDIEVWIEPFAGGAGAALAAVEQHDVPEAWLVERNPALAAFWEAVITDGEQFARAVENTSPTLSLFGWARELVAEACSGQLSAIDGPTLDLPMAAFLLNRCSRSGIIAPNVGPVGGKRQDGQWTVQSRWNGPALADRIRRVAALKDRLRVMTGDGIDYLEELPDSGIEHEVFVFADPPYIAQGPALYAQSLTDTGHDRLATALRNLPGPWLATYDADPRVCDLYRGLRMWQFTAPHSAGPSRIDSEYLIFGDAVDYQPDKVNPLGKGSIGCPTHWALTG